MLEEEGVAVLLNTLVVDAVMEGDIIKGVVVENADGRVEIRGKIVIDCTGEAYLSARAGAETVCVSREEIQPHTMSFTVDGDHCLPTSAWDISRCIIECRKQNQIAWRFIKNYLPGFKNAYITKQCMELRIREGPRIVGDYVLTREDVAAARTFKDTIGKSSFKAGGYHVSNMDTLASFKESEDVAIPAGGGSYDIPYRCLVPRKIDNLLAAGKCVSTDRPAYLRYVHQTMVTGQAAGVAAALCARDGITPRELEKDVSELQKILTQQGAMAIKRQTGSGFAVASIGPAGENLCRISCIINDYGRAAARQGLGAVMGSKKLKAIAVKGSKKVPVADEAAYRKVLERLKEDIKNKTRMANNIGRFGTAAVFVNNVFMQDAPIQNWKGVSEEVFPLGKAEKLSAENYVQYFKRKYACSQCTIGCGAILEVQGSRNILSKTHRPEYETIAAFGSNCLVDNLETIMLANELCNRYGLDTISAGATVAFAMECYEKGLITDKETDGVRLTWGNSEAVISLLESMAKREGLGAILADGVKSASEKIGGSSADFAIHIGGQEPGNHDPRCWPGYGYGYVLDPKFGHHTTGTVGFMEHGWTEKELDHSQFAHLGKEKYINFDSKGKPMALLNSWLHFFYATGLCLFTYYAYNQYPVLDALKANTGWKDFDLEEAIKAGERINTLRHCFNLREGINPQKITLPKRLMGVPPLPSGPIAGVTIDIEKVKKSYYKEMDWDLVTGKPSAEKLASLGLSGLVSDL